MKRTIFIVVLLILGGIFSLSAQDIIVLRDGSMIDANVVEISPTEIRYKRFSHLDGPTIVVLVSDVLSIRYENGTVEVFNTVPALGQTDLQTNAFQEVNMNPQLNQPTALQNILNTLPAVPIAGNNLKFEFGGEFWVARVNGENFSAGNIELEVTAEGAVLTLRQTHIWPGAVGRTAGRVANIIPGGGAVGGVLNTAGNVAGALGPIETSGTIVLEYRAGPPASLRLVSSSDNSSQESPQRLSSYPSFSLGGIISYTQRKQENIYTWGTSGGSFSIINFMYLTFNARYLFPLSNNLYLGLGLDFSFSPFGLWSSDYYDSISSTMTGTLAPYVIIGYKNIFLHSGYDLAEGSLYLSPNFTVNERLMVGFPIKLFGGNQYGIASLIVPPEKNIWNNYNWLRTNLKTFQIGLSIQYVFGK